MRWKFAPAALLPLLTLACSGAEPHDGEVGATQAPIVSAPNERVEVFVIMDRAPVAATWRSASDPEVRATAAKRHRDELRQDHVRMRKELAQNGAVVMEELVLLANAFHVEVKRASLPRLRAIPGVKAVEPAPMFHATLNRGLRSVRAPEAWSAPLGLHGAGIKVGIIDTGVDYYHAAIGGTGNPADFSSDNTAIIEAGTFPTARVVGGYDFVGDNYNPEVGASTIAEDPDPLDCEGHGTHVASIAAGNAVNEDGSVFIGSYDQSLDLNQFRVAPGVAPEAEIYALKVFGCARGTSVVASALEWAADPNDDGMPDDRLDVVNLSLGSSYDIAGQLFYGQVMDNLVGVGTVVVAAAGNDGGTFFVTGSPGSVPPVLSVAASVDAGLTNVLTTAGDITGVEGAITQSLSSTGSITAAASRAEPADACTLLTNSAEVAGTIVLIDRGSCSFQDKLTRAAAAGAVGAIIIQNDGDPPFSMGGNGSVGIPGVMVSQADGQNLVASLMNGSLTITLSADPYEGPGAEQVAGLSSRGPGLDGITVKPEIAAPGVGVDAADVGSGTQPTNKSGTSMASPFVAGAAALVREAQPALTALDVKAMLMNHAQPIVGTTGARFPVSMQGTGRLDVARAAEGAITMRDAQARDLMGVTFGAHVTDEVWTDTRTVEVKNHGQTVRTFAVSANPHRNLPGVTITTTPPSVTVAPGQTQAITVDIEVDPEVFGTPPLDPFTPPEYDFGQGDPNPRHALVEIDGYVQLDDSTDTVRLPYYAFVRPGARRRGVVGECSSEEVIVTTEGASAHPNPVVSAFQLGVADPVNLPEEEAIYDIRATGAASDLPTAETFEDVSVFFGVAVEGTWTTPAAGPISAAGVIIDVNDDDIPDYAVVAEPLGAEGPYLDLLASTTYDLSQCEGGSINSCLESERKRYLNIVPSTTVDTVPFFNGVVVFAAFADQIGLTPEQTRFRYAGVTLSIYGEQERTAWASYDVGAPALDPSTDAPIEGRPVFEANQQIRVRRGDGGSGQLLLLHHTNLEGLRFEVVDVGLPGGVVVNVTGPSATTDDQAVMRVEVRNDGAAVIESFTVDLSAEGGAISAINAPGLDCGASQCDIGGLGPGQNLAFDVTVDAQSNASQVLFTAEARSGGGCSVTAEAAVSRELPEPPEGSVFDVGCGCTVVGQPDDEPLPGWLLLLGLFAVPLARRRG